MSGYGHYLENVAITKWEPNLSTRQKRIFCRVVAKETPHIILQRFQASETLGLKLLEHLILLGCHRLLLDVGGLALADGEGGLDLEGDELHAVLDQGLQLEIGGKL